LNSDADLLPNLHGGNIAHWSGEIPIIETNINLIVITDTAAVYTAINNIKDTAACAIRQIAIRSNYRNTINFMGSL